MASWLRGLASWKHWALHFDWHTGISPQHVTTRHQVTTAMVYIGACCLLFGDNSPRQDQPMGSIYLRRAQ